MPRTEIERQFTESLGNLQRDAQVPGFRPGRAPRQLVEKRFRKQVSEQVKSSLLMASLEQIDAGLRAQSDHSAKPGHRARSRCLKRGRLSFEMDVEVRPDFTVPSYRGAQDQAARQDHPSPRTWRPSSNAILERYSEIVPKLEGAADRRLPHRRSDVSPARRPAF